MAYQDYIHVPDVSKLTTDELRTRILQTRKEIRKREVKVAGLKIVKYLPSALVATGICTGQIPVDMTSICLFTSGYTMQYFKNDLFYQHEEVGLKKLDIEADKKIASGEELASETNMTREPESLRYYQGKRFLDLILLLLSVGGAMMMTYLLFMDEVSIVYIASLLASYPSYTSGRDQIIEKYDEQMSLETILQCYDEELISHLLSELEDDVPPKQKTL